MFAKIFGPEEAELDRLIDVVYTTNPQLLDYLEKKINELRAKPKAD